MCRTLTSCRGASLRLVFGASSFRRVPRLAEPALNHVLASGAILIDKHDRQRGDDRHGQMPLVIGRQAIGRDRRPQRHEHWPVGLGQLAAAC